MDKNNTKKNNLYSSEEENTLKLYRNIYSTGVEPKVFLNEILEWLIAKGTFPK